MIDIITNLLMQIIPIVVLLAIIVIIGLYVYRFVLKIKKEIGGDDAS